jgi:hypothetical protein
MKLSGQSQAELIKAALVVAAAGVIVYYGKKFVDGFTSKVGSLADAPAKAVTALGAAIGSAGSAVVESAKAGIEKANENIKQTAKEGGKTFQDANTKGDPLITEQGMDFRYF